LALVASAGGDFDRGFEKGFDEGYRFVRGEFAISPIPPIPPIPRIDQEDRFFGGYNVGFVTGVARARGDCPQ